MSEPPNLAPEPGWSPLVPPEGSGEHRSFVSGDPDGDRLRVRYYVPSGGEGLVGKVWFGPAAEGPPGYAHGGSLAAVLDEAMGVTAWMAGHTAVAAEIVVRYIAPVPLHSTLRLEAHITSKSGRKVRTSGFLENADKKRFCHAEGLFVELDPEFFGRLATASMREQSRE